MPLNRNAPRESMPEAYEAMRLVTYAEYDGVTLDDYVDLGGEEPVTDGGLTVIEGDRVRVKDDSPSPHAGETGEVVTVDHAKSCIVEFDGRRCRHATAELEPAEEVTL